MSRETILFQVTSHIPANFVRNDLLYPATWKPIWNFIILNKKCSHQNYRRNAITPSSHLNYWALNLKIILYQTVIDCTKNFIKMQWHSDYHTFLHLNIFLHFIILHRRPGLHKNHVHCRRKILDNNEKIFRKIIFM